jgi:hypothetical protein
VYLLRLPYYQRVKEETAMAWRGKGREEWWRCRRNRGQEVNIYTTGEGPGKRANVRIRLPKEKEKEI